MDCRQIYSFLLTSGSWLLNSRWFISSFQGRNQSRFLEIWGRDFLSIALLGAFMIALPTAVRAGEIQWLGTAGFALYSGQKTLLIAPYLSRNERARPFQPLGPEDFPDTEAILISHGHFDHLKDVPEIVRKTNATVYCSKKAGKTLLREGVPAQRIVALTGKTALPIDGFSVTAHTSKHVVFDLPLIWRTLARARFNVFKYVPLLTKWPKGQVFSYRIEMEGLSLHHFGTAGCGRKELEDLRRQSLDVLLLPLQGHSHICRIGANITKALNPKVVIAHHHDDFYPPVSTMIDIQPFIEEIQKECPAIRIQELHINRLWTVELKQEIL